VTVIASENLSKWFGDVIALNDVSASLSEGVTGLLGPNGAGKSTLLQVVAGLAKPSAGQIEVFGENPWNNPRVAERVGFVPEGKAPWPDATGLEATVRAARLSGLDQARARERADAVLEETGLTSAASREVSAYSLGMQQRLKLALALAHEPELLVLDEPLIGVDPLTRRDLVQAIEAHADRGNSALLSTHALRDVQAIADEVLVLDAGRVAAQGSIDEVRAYVEGFRQRIRIGTDDPVTVGETLWAWPEIASVSRDEEGLLVETDDPATAYEKLQTELAEGTLDITSITSPDESIESIFEQLVG
jgi:ABC-2 type transport system ATP-binding protein